MLLIEANRSLKKFDPSGSGSISIESALSDTDIRLRCVVGYDFDCSLWTGKVTGALDRQLENAAASVLACI